MAKDSVLTFSANKSGKGESFHLKPIIVPHWSSLHTMRYKDRGYDSKSLYVPLTTQVFWLWFVFSLHVHVRELGEGRYIRYEDSMQKLIDIEMNKPL